MREGRHGLVQRDRLRVLLQPLRVSIQVLERGAAGRERERQRELEVAALGRRVVDVLLVDDRVEGERRHRPAGVDVAAEGLMRVGEWQAGVEHHAVDVRRGGAGAFEGRLHVLAQPLVELPGVDGDRPAERDQGVVDVAAEVPRQRPRQQRIVLVPELGESLPRGELPPVHIISDLRDMAFEVRQQFVSGLQLVLEVRPDVPRLLPLRRQRPRHVLRDGEQLVDQEHVVHVRRRDRIRPRVVPRRGQAGGTDAVEVGGEVGQPVLALLYYLRCLCDRVGVTFKIDWLRQHAAGDGVNTVGQLHQLGI